MFTLINNNSMLIADAGNNKLNPNYVSGFIDAEGCFHVSIVKNLTLSLGASVRAVFQISLHIKDEVLLKKFRDFFGVGRVAIRSDGAVVYEVSSLKDLQIILKHLETYPLITDKWADLQLFKQVVELMVNKEHLTMEGLVKIINIKASMNFGTISETIRSLIPTNIEPVKRPAITNIKIYSPNWVVGYIEGEGMFFVNIYKKKESVLGEGVKLVFKVTQDRKNLALLESFTNVFTAGKVYQQSPTAKVMDFLITGLADITKYVIPFFQGHPLEGAKKNDFKDFMKVAELMKAKAHLNKDGLEKIRLIKQGMNSNRY
jgi:hypothetical protein